MTNLEKVQEEVVDLFDLLIDDLNVYIYTTEMVATKQRAVVVERGEEGDPKTVRVFLKDPKNYTYSLKDNSDSKKTYVKLGNLIKRISDYYSNDAHEVNCVLTEIESNGTLKEKYIIWTNKHN